MPHIYRPIAASAAMAAALSLGTPQAFALDMPMHSNAPAEAYSGADDVQQHHRYRRHRRGIDAGDVFAGVLVLGAVAAIAGAANNDRRDRRERVESYPRRDNVRYRDTRQEQRYDSRGIDRAVDMCVEQVERGDTRVDTIDSASRVADGWRVSGALGDGEAWSCWIDNDGRVRSVDFGASYSASASAETAPTRNSVRFESAAAAGEGQPQLSDAAYARARAGQNAEADTQLRAREEELRGGEAAYPGGPVAGEEYPGGEWVDDGRYNSAEVDADLDRS